MLSEGFPVVQVVMAVLRVMASGMEGGREIVGLTIKGMNE